MTKWSLSRPPIRIGGGDFLVGTRNEDPSRPGEAVTPTRPSRVAPAGLSGQGPSAKGVPFGLRVGPWWGR